MTVTNTPERIRVAQDADGFWTCREAISGSQEYVRADIFEAALSSRSAEAGKPVVTMEMIDRLVDAEVEDVLSNSDGGAPSIEKQKLLTREIDDARKAIEAAFSALSTPADIEPVAWRYVYDDAGGVRHRGCRLEKPTHHDGYPVLHLEPLYAAPVADREPVSVPEGGLDPTGPSAPLYRFLTEGDIIEATDEFISDNFQRWVPPSGWEVGMEYPSRVFKPVRRLVLSTLPIAGAVRKALERLCEYADAEYVPNVLFEQARKALAAPQPNPSRFDAEGFGLRCVGGDCEYSKSVSMPEYQCVGKCQYESDHTAVRKLSLWFFRDLSGEQRGKLFGLFGMNDAQKDTNHGYQAMALSQVVRALAAQGEKP